MREDFVGVRGSCGCAAPAPCSGWAVRGCSRAWVMVGDGLVLMFAGADVYIYTRLV